jgi:hypothetical protein
LKKEILFQCLCTVCLWEVFAVAQVLALEICMPHMRSVFESAYQGRPLPKPTNFAIEYIIYLWWVHLSPILGLIVAFLKRSVLWMWLGIVFGTWVLWIAFWLSFTALVFPFARF